MTKLKRREFLAHTAAVFSTAQFVPREANAAPAGELISTIVGSNPPIPSERFSMGTSHRPNGQSLTVDARSLLLNDKRWIPAMGEFHYARYPENLWRTELLKMKAGGLQIVSTYVFWIYHEEQQGLWRWNGRRDLRRFAQLCNEVGLLLVVRCGPWCHGEVRNGGFPDWLLHSECKLRSTDPKFLGFTRELYSQIALQLRDLLWKDGGPVIGIQVDNEYGGPAEYLLALKSIAMEVGIDVPLYNRTGWPKLSTPMPSGRLLPLYGAYADGFWDRSLAPMPSEYLSSFEISPAPNSQAAAMGTAPSLASPSTRPNQLFRYPYFCCEIGGGMETSYHRRIRIEPPDVYSTALVKLASGNSLQGYYMYHGGTNPRGRLTSMEENQASGGWNDLPELSYDFFAPLGEYGEIRPHYGLLRKLHLFLQANGEKLAVSQCVIPKQPANFSWSLRTDNDGGYLFVNNYAMLTPHKAVPNVMFNVRLPNGEITVPSKPFTLPANSSFFWQIGTDFVCTSQPLFHLDVGDRLVSFYEKIPGIPAEWQLRSSTYKVTRVGRVTRRSMISENKMTVLNVTKPGRDFAFEYINSNGRLHAVVLLSPEDAASTSIINLGAARHVIICRQPVWQDGESIVVDAPMGETVELAALPPLPLHQHGIAVNTTTHQGLFVTYSVPTEQTTRPSVRLIKVREAGPAREIKLGKAGVAEAPVDSDFRDAAVWRIDVDWAKIRAMHGTVILEVDYQGDCARYYHGSKLLVDNFYNGRPFALQIDPAYFGDLEGELQLQILPLSKGEPVYLPASAIPPFDPSGTPIARVLKARIIARRQVPLAIRVGLPTVTS